MEHARLLPGFKSSFASIVCVALNPSSVSTAIMFKKALLDGIRILRTIFAVKVVLVARGYSSG
jgi:hypothetical protein